MGYKKLIRNWHSKAAEEDYFSKFVFEYLAFIAHLKTQKYSSSDKDRTAIQKLKQDEDVKRRYIQLISTKTSLRSAWEHIKTELERSRLGNVSGDLNVVEEIKWWNCSYEDLQQMSQEEQNEIKGVLRSLEDWGNMVEFWHSIRNNLFHGAKDPDRKRDQFAVKYGFLTLKELMEMLLDE